MNLATARGARSTKNDTLSGYGIHPAPAGRSSGPDRHYSVHASQMGRSNLNPRHLTKIRVPLSHELDGRAVHSMLSHATTPQRRKNTTPPVPVAAPPPAAAAPPAAVEAAAAAAGSRRIEVGQVRSGRGGRRGERRDRFRAIRVRGLAFSCVPPPHAPPSARLLEAGVSDAAYTRSGCGSHSAWAATRSAAG